MHVYAHAIICQIMLNPEKIPGTGRCAGEFCEQLWADLGTNQRMVLEMASGVRRTQLDASLLHIAKRKSNAMGKYLKDRFSDVEEALHVAILIFKDVIGNEYTVQSARVLYQSEKKGGVNTDVIDPKSDLPVLYQTKRNQIRSLARRRLQMVRLRPSHRVQGGYRNTGAISNQIKQVENEIKNEIAALNEQIMDLKETETEWANVSLLTYQTAIDVWADTLSEEKRKHNTIIESYCEVIKSLM